MTDFRRGDESAFEAIFDRYHGRILAFCRHMLGSREDGEDATQHVFVSAHRALLTSAAEMELRPWLFAVARNRCLDVLRSRRGTTSLDALVDEPRAPEGLPEIVQRREDLRALVADIAALPEDQREALVLFEMGGLTQRKLAEVLDRRPEQVKALVYQARAALLADRRARETDCEAIRLELASARGHQLLQANLRRHLRVCASCAAFAEAIGSQRVALADALPVLPTAGLKATTLAAAGATGATVAGSAGAGGSVAGLVGKGVALKALGLVCAVGAAGGVGYSVVRHVGTTRPGVATAASVPPRAYRPTADVDSPHATPRQRATTPTPSRVGDHRRSMKHRAVSRGSLRVRRHRARTKVTGHHVLTYGPRHGVHRDHSHVQGWHRVDRRRSPADRRGAQPTTDRASPPPSDSSTHAAYDTPSDGRASGTAVALHVAAPTVAPARGLDNHALGQQDPGAQSSDSQGSGLQRDRPAGW